MAGKKWNEESRRKWGEKQRLRNEALKAGLDPDRASGSGGSDRDGAGDDGGDGNGGDRSHSGGEGRNLLSGSSRKSTEKKPGEGKPLIDFPAIKPALPGLLIDYNELWDDVLRAVTSGKWAKRLWYVKELTAEKAKAEAEFLWPLFQSLVEKIIGSHPVLAGLGILFGRPLMRIRSQEKPKEEKPNAESTAKKEETAGT